MHLSSNLYAKGTGKLGYSGKPLLSISIGLVCTYSYLFTRCIALALLSLWASRHNSLGIDGAEKGLFFH